MNKHTEQKINDKNAELLLDEALKKVSHDWHARKSIKSKFDAYVSYRKKLDEAHEEENKKLKLALEKIHLDRSSRFDPLKKKSLFDIRAWILEWEFKKKQNIAILINMEKSNGEHDTFYAYPVAEKFEYNKGIYVIDHKMKYYNQTVKKYCLDYHEDFNLPIQRKIPISEIRQAVGSAGITAIENATNPRVLKQWFESDVILKLLQGQELAAFIQKITTLLYIILIISGIHAVIFVIKSGMLQQIHF